MSTSIDDFYSQYKQSSLYTSSIDPSIDNLKQVVNIVFEGTRADGGVTATIVSEYEACELLSIRAILRTCC